jgi:hypothetical protein
MRLKVTGSYPYIGGGICIFASLMMIGSSPWVYGGVCAAEEKLMTGCVVAS